MRRIGVFVVAATTIGCVAALLALQRAESGAAAPADRRLTVTVDAGSGTVRSTPAGIDCPQACSAVFPADTPITLTATPAADFRFDAWDFPSCTVQPTRSNECRVTLTTFDLRVGVIFRPAATVHVFPNGEGAVTVAPPGIDLATGNTLARCGSEKQDGCRLAYRPGTRVTGTAVPGSGRSFARWGGAGCRSGPCTVEAVAGETMLVATFNPLQLEVRTSGQGAVTSTPAGIVCSLDRTDCTVAAPLGARFVLDAGNTPHEWKFGCEPEGGNPRAARCTVTVAAAPTVAGVSFGGAGGPGEPGRIDTRLDLRTSGPASAAVQGRKIDCRQRTCSARYKFGDMEELRPVETPGARFDRWINGCGAMSVCRFPVGPIFSLEAVFVAPLSARFVSVGTTGRRAQRTVVARLQVSRSATLALQLVRAGRPVAARSVPLKTGQTTVRLKVPRGAAAGRYAVVATVRAGTDRRRLTRFIEVGRP